MTVLSHLGDSAKQVWTFETEHLQKSAMIRQDYIYIMGGARLLTSMVKWSERMVSSQMCQHQAFVNGLYT